MIYPDYYFLFPYFFLSALSWKQTIPLEKSESLLWIERDFPIDRFPVSSRMSSFEKNMPIQQSILEKKATSKRLTFKTKHQNSKVSLFINQRASIKSAMPNTSVFFYPAYGSN